ncbi:MAG: MATE family efflux transporter [Thalassovita sp.]
MSTSQTKSQHLISIFTLGLPLVGSHIAQFSVTLTDTIMLGWYNVEALAAQVIAGTMFFVLFILGSGFAQAVMPMVAESEEAGDGSTVRRVTRMSIWASLIYALLALPVLLNAEPILLALGQTAEVAAMGREYLDIAGWAIFPALFVMVLKSFLSGLERAQVVLWVTVGAVLVNIVVNYALIFGNWGFPEMGLRGAAIASLAVQVVSALLLGIYVIIVTPEHQMFQRFWRPDWEAFWRVFRLGVPIGLTSLAEVGLFAAASVMMGWIGTIALAAHGIAMQMSAIAFMIHLGLSNAATVRAGRALGRKNLEDLRLGGKLVTLVSLSFVGATIAVFLLLPEYLIGLFMSPDDESYSAVVEIGVILLAAAAVFQLADALQAIALGLLRGVQDTSVPMVIAGISYWIVGVPVSYVMGFWFGWGGVGIWMGLAFGLGVAAVLLMLRFWGPVIRRIAERM